MSVVACPRSSGFAPKPARTGPGPRSYVTHNNPAADTMDRVGRPPKRPEERASARIQLVCTKQEKKLIEQAAAKADTTLSRWIIEQALRAATSEKRR